MKLRTSYSKFTPLRKNLTRFMPLWVLYLVGIFLALSAGGGYAEYYDVYARRNMESMVQAFGMINLVFGGICAMALFGDLFNTKLCYSLHAMPQRRESWLLSHLGAGFLFSLVPNLLGALLLMGKLEDYWFLALYWLLASQLQFMFFFGIGALSAMLTGNRFAMLTVYAFFNFVAMLAYAAVNLLYVPMLTGVVVDTSGFTKFSPVVHLLDFDFFTFRSMEREGYVAQPGGYDYMPAPTYYEYLGLGSGWGYLTILGIVGLLAMVAAWILYRKRHLECAGDFVAFTKLKGVMCVVLTVCVALFFALLGMLQETMVIWLAVGLVVGFFGSLMLLERRVKVFRKKTFLGFALLAIVVALSFVSVELDWFGIEHWTPQAERVQSVTIYNYRSSGYYYDYAGSRISATLTERSDIEAVITAHEDILSRLDTEEKDTHNVTIEYTLESGRKVTRVYAAPANGTNYEVFSRYFNDEKQLLGYGNQSWEEFVSSITYLRINYQEIPKALRPDLMEALRLDCADGGIAFADGKEYDCIVEYYTEDTSGRTNTYRVLRVTAKAEHTLALLKKPEYILGYEDYDTYLAGISSIYVNGATILSKDVAGFMEAILADIAEDNIALSLGGNELHLSVTIQYFGNYRMLPLTKYAENTVKWLLDNGYEELMPG